MGPVLGPKRDPQKVFSNLEDKQNRARDEFNQLDKCHNCRSIFSTHLFERGFSSSLISLGDQIAKPGFPAFTRV